MPVCSKERTVMRRAVLTRTEVRALRLLHHEELQVPVSSIISARALSASRLRPLGLTETVLIHVFCLFNEKKLTSFPNEKRCHCRLYGLRPA